jgi:hypothetical protein
VAAGGRDRSPLPPHGRPAPLTGLGNPRAGSRVSVPQGEAAAVGTASPAFRGSPPTARGRAAGKTRKFLGAVGRAGRPSCSNGVVGPTFSHGIATFESLRAGHDGGTVLRTQEKPLPPLRSVLGSPGTGEEGSRPREQETSQSFCLAAPLPRPHPPGGGRGLGKGAGCRDRPPTEVKTLDQPPATQPPAYRSDAANAPNPRPAPQVKTTAAALTPQPPPTSQQNSRNDRK